MAAAFAHQQWRWKSRENAHSSLLPSLMPSILLCKSKELGFSLKLVGVCICNLLNNVQFLILGLTIFKGLLAVRLVLTLRCSL